MCTIQLIKLIYYFKYLYLKLYSACPYKYSAGYHSRGTFETFNENLFSKNSIIIVAATNMTLYRRKIKKSETG